MITRYRANSIMDGKEMQTKYLRMEELFPLRRTSTEEVFHRTESMDVAGVSPYVSLDEYWTHIFQKLAKLGSRDDWKLSRTTLLDWLNTLDFQETLAVEVREGVTKERIKDPVAVPGNNNNNGYIDLEEFLDLVQNRSQILSNTHKTKLLEYLRIAAYAEEYR